MHIRQIKTIWGPNLFHHKSILLASLDLGEWAEVHSASLPGFTPRLVRLLPILKEHRCSPGRPGGFEERMRRGTYFGHIVEHVALALAELAGIGVGYGKTVYGGAPGIYQIAIRFRSEAGMKFLLEESASLVQALAEGRGFQVAACVEEARRIVRAQELGPSTKAILEAADRRGIPWKRLSEESLIQLGHGKQRRFVQATTSCFTSEIATDIAQDKELTKAILRRASLPVPRGETVSTASEAVEAWRRIGAPVAVKPLDSHQGNGVSLAIDEETSVCNAFLLASGHSKKVLVEEHVNGQDLRVLVVNGQMVAASRRVPAFVTGDGQCSISELIDTENENPLRGEGHERPLTRIVKDEALAAYLHRKGLGLWHIPAAGEQVFLRETANLSTGGSAEDITAELHPTLRNLCEMASQVVGLDICGVDLIVEDPLRPWQEQHPVILELNAGPGIRMHHFPSAGEARDAGSAILSYLFPKGWSGRVPIASITGTNGKTTVSRLLGHFLEESGITAGVTTSDGILVGGHCIAEGDTTGPLSAEAVLANPLVEAAVLETARGGIVRGGLGYDWSDVGVLTNIQPDHIGQDGIETLDDIVRIKALVAERVREGGTLILNAEDQNLLKIAESKAVRRIPKTLVLFSVDPTQFALRRHLAQGGRGYFERNGALVEAGPEEERPLIASHEIPLTYGGTARFQIANALAAAAAGRALGLSPEQVAKGLRTFEPNRNNSGRANVYRVGKGFLLVDYGHNPEAFGAISAMTTAWTQRRVTGVIGLPGDRSDGMIQLAAKAAAQGFDRIFVREDVDLRGRRPGETAELISQAVHDEVPSLPCMVEPDGRKCLDRAVAEMEPGEVVVYFYEDIEILRETLRTLGAEPVKKIADLFHAERRDHEAG